MCLQHVRNWSTTVSFRNGAMNMQAATPSLRLRWNQLYGEAELYKAAVRVYTKPLFQWQKALGASSDRRNLYDFARHGLHHLEQMHHSLAGRSFHFRPSLALHYNFNGKHRTLYVAPWEERIVDLLLYRVLNQRLQAWFSPNSYAYRSRRLGLDRCQQGVARALRASPAPRYVLKRDIADYFASVDHEILLAHLAALVEPDDYLYQLLDERVRFRYLEEGEERRATVGIPFGTAIACLLSNIYLTRLDRAMEALDGIRYFRYADDILVLADHREAALGARERLESEFCALRLSVKPSHCLDCVFAQEAEPPFAGAGSFRHLGLEFSAGGAVRLSRDKQRKICNLFRFAFRRRRSRFARLRSAEERVRLAIQIARRTVEQGLRNVAILDYYLKHVEDEGQLRALDRWLAEEVLSMGFGGHRKGNFRRLSFAGLRAMGLPSLVHRHRLIRHREIESPFFIWKQSRVARARKGTAARRRPAAREGASGAFSPLPEAAGT
jgi:retron-type reverse transcriptase